MTRAEIVKWRERIHATQEEAADLLGISLRTIQKCEDGIVRIPIWFGEATQAIEDRLKERNKVEPKAAESNLNSIDVPTREVGESGARELPERRPKGKLAPRP